MTREEYERYQKAVAESLVGLTAISSGYCSGCDECSLYCDGDGDGDPIIEPWYSQRRCEVCGLTLAGNRYPVHGVTEDNEIVHLDACENCVYYIEYGRLNDTTMERMG